MKCQNKATHRFTWPGQKESFICDKHVGKLRAVAKAMGFHLDIHPTHESDFENELCRQEIETDN